MQRVERNINEAWEAFHKENPSLVKLEGVDHKNLFTGVIMAAQTIQQREKKEKGRFDWTSAINAACTSAKNVHSGNHAALALIEAIRQCEGMIQDIWKRSKSLIDISTIVVLLRNEYRKNP